MIKIINAKTTVSRKNVISNYLPLFTAISKTMGQVKAEKTLESKPKYQCQ